MYAIDYSSGRVEPCGAVIYYSPGYFKSMALVRNCLCADGERRSVRVTGEPDSAFTIPARTKARGKTVSGFLTYLDWPTESGKALVFVPTGRNRHVIDGEYSRIIRRAMERVDGRQLPPAYTLRDSVTFDYR